MHRFAPGATVHAASAVRDRARTVHASRRPRRARRSRGTTTVSLDQRLRHHGARIEQCQCQPTGSSPPHGVRSSSTGRQYLRCTIASEWRKRREATRAVFRPNGESTGMQRPGVSPGEGMATVAWNSRAEPPKRRLTAQTVRSAAFAASRRMGTVDVSRERREASEGEPQEVIGWNGGTHGDQR